LKGSFSTGFVLSNYLVREFESELCPACFKSIVPPLEPVFESPVPSLEFFFNFPLNHFSEFD